MRTYRLTASLRWLSVWLAAAVSLQSCGGDDLGCNGPFCVSPPERPEPAAIAPDPESDGQTGAPGQELQKPLAVQVTDDQGRAVPGVVVHFTVNSGGGQLSTETAQSDTLGLAAVRWILGQEIGTQRIKAEAVNSDNVPLANSPLELTANAQLPPPASLVLHSGLPETAQNGVPLEPQPVLDVVDANDHAVPGIEVTASVSSGGGSVTGGTTATSDENGVATFTDLALTGPEGAQVLTFSVAGLPVQVSSAPIQLSAGTAASLSGIEPLSYEGTVNSAVSPGPSVVVKDAAGNPVPGIPVTFSTNRNASVSPEVATSNEQGIAQVSWTLGTTANTEYALTARIESSPVQPVRFTATARAGAAGRLRITTQPSSPTASGTPFAQQPVLQVVDANGNPAAQPGVVVAASISAGPAGSVSNASATTDANGQAAFSGLTVTGLAGNYTLGFSAPGIAGITSAAFAITVGSAAKLAFVTKPSTHARSRALLVIQPELQIQDASGNPIAQGGVEVTATALPSGTLVGGQTVVTDERGRAVFTGLTLTGTPGPKDLTFTAQGLQTIGSRVTLPSVATVAAAPSHPVSAVVGTTVAGPVISWTFRDASTRPVPDADFTLTVPSGGTALPTAAFSDLNGVVQVGDWTLGTTAGYQYLELRLPDGRTFRDSIVATPGAAADLVKVSGDDPVQEAPVNSELPKLFVVRVVDQYGNGVANVNVQWSTCDGTPGTSGPADAEGYSSVRQPTGSEPSGDAPYCTRATAQIGDVAHSVDFHYVVTGAAPAGTEQPQGMSATQSRHSGPPPVVPWSDPRQRR